MITIHELIFMMSNKKLSPIDLLNDDCLQKIFDYIPISQLLSLELVSQRWKRLIQYRNERQISLKIFFGKTEYNSYLKNDHFFYQLKSCPYFQQNNDFMLVTHLNYLSCHLLLTKYPNLKMLFISGCLFEPPDLMMLLFELKKLECFSLIICNKPSEDAYFNAMIKTIDICLSLDRLPSLKHFAISLAHNTLTNPFSTDFIFRIEELYLHNVAIDYSNYFEDVMKNKELKLKKFAAYNQKRSFQMDESACKALSNSVKQLTILCGNRISFKTKLELLCNNFTSLIYLDLHLKRSVELKVLYTLNKLPQLKEFRLRADENCAIAKDEPETFDEYSVPILPVQLFHLDIDFEPMIFALLTQIFPAIKHLSMNASRICCICPNNAESSQDNHKALAPEMPQANAIQNQPNPVDQINNENVDNNNQQPMNANDSVDNIEFELDNCLKCFEQTIKSLEQWKLLTQLSIIGNRCKDEAIGSLKMLQGLRSLSLANCEEFSLRSILNVCYQIAKNRPSTESFVLNLNETYFKKIIQLPLKPENLSIFNVNPIFDIEIELEKQKLKIPL